MTGKKRETVGKISTDLIQKQADNTHSAHDQMEESLTDYDKNIYECALDGVKKYPNDFFIVVVNKRERLMSNVFRNYFINRITCPTPDYDQTVYKFNKKSGDIEFIWVVPDQQACQYLINNALTLPAEERALLDYVLLFRSGDLYIRAKKLNNEQY